MPAEPLPQIRVLDDHVCNQIAAGEVIERPASVFKELVENAVDAGASELLVEVLQGGRKAVIVTDNGCGMNRDNCLLAIERHATSKIRGVEDIERIHSMGFRGEALAAIASVSRFSLESRPWDQLEGTRIQVDGGKLADVTEVGCPPGTRIDVRNLFFNTPARRKFLRTESTELAYIRTLFQTFAIAHPDVALRLQVDGRLLEQLPAQPHLADRIADLQGQEVFSQLRRVDYARGELRIHGFAGLPTLHRSDRRDQVTLINRRPATAPLLGYAIRQAFADSLPAGRHPILFLHLDMPAEWVDVNVHPTKREVRFGPSHLIRDTLIEALARTLESGTGPRPAQKEPQDPGSPLPPSLQENQRQQDFSPDTPAYPPLPPRMPSSSSPGVDMSPPPERIEGPAADSTGTPPEQTPSSGPGSWRHATYLGQQDEFHLLSIDTGLVVLLPRAARERILYETVRNEWETRKTATQKLLIPETVSCSAEEARRIRETLPLLQELGFDLADFGSDSFIIEGVPAWLTDIPMAELLHSLAMEVQEGRSQKGPDVIRERIARSCCRLAAAHRRTPTPDAALQLLHQLANCQMPYTTPFGKPTLLHLGTDDFRKKFGIS
jgi:DNA mismatch repair protein MutL